MRAILHQQYGGPEHLVVGDRPTPSPGPGEVRVRVHAASVNAADCRIMRADPFLVRLANGWLRPKRWPVMGSDFAGVVDAVGTEVEHVSVGDAVMGDASPGGRGAFAEYLCVDAGAIVTKPDGLSFVEAAAVPLAGITALQAVRDAGGVEPGDHVLVYGAGGGVGGFAVQLAVARGARVTAVCGPRSLRRVASFGAERVLDYTCDDVADEAVAYDVILAVNGWRPLHVYRDALARGGRYVSVGGTNRQIFEGLLLTPFVFAGRGKRGTVLTIDNRRITEDLAELRGLLTTRRLRPVIDRTFPLDAAAEAITYVERGHVAGKVVLVAAPEPTSQTAPRALRPSLPHRDEAHR